MKERPILFSAPMVRAILDGRKTQTRRAVKGSYIPIVEECLRVNGKWVFDTMEYELKTPYGRPGDRLWVRETCRIRAMPIKRNERFSAVVSYAADGAGKETTAHMDQWRLAYDERPNRVIPTIHMPRWASRILLEIVSVRVERLNEISAGDCKAEGLWQATKDERLWKWGLEEIPWQDWRISPIDAYQGLWESINGAGSWAANPWVWVVEFKRVQP
jgi:hypothetical protein